MKPTSKKTEKLGELLFSFTDDFGTHPPLQNVGGGSGGCGGGGGCKGGSGGSGGCGGNSATDANKY
jgi:hypothetical protein